jgi:predicted outer membrane repeat protein
VHVQAQSRSTKPVSLKVASQTDLSALNTAALRPNAVIDAMWQGTVKLTKPIIVGERTTLTIIGESVATAIADGGGKTQLFDVGGQADLVLVNMTLTNGFTDSASGGAVRLGEFASLTASGTLFSNNAVRDGLVASNSSRSLIDDAPYLPVGSSSADDQEVTDEMTVGGFGGAVSGGLNSTISIINSTFVRNTASMAGGAIATEAGIEDGLIITNSVFDGNAACVDNTGQCYGGGAVAHTAFVNISNTTFHNNSAIAEPSEIVTFGGGGALYDFSIRFFGSAEDVNGTTNIELCNFTDNTAYYYGGAAFLEGYVTLSECLFEGNSADRGGAIEVFDFPGVMTITRCIFATNTASFGDGGAVANSAIPPGDEHHLIEESTFFNNSAGSVGGALFSIGDIYEGLVVRSSNFSSNTALYGGGAISCGGIRVENCLFTSNKGTTGGAISLEGENSLVYITSVVLANNSIQWGCDSSPSRRPLYGGCEAD